MMKSSALNFYCCWLITLALTLTLAVFTPLAEAQSVAQLNAVSISGSRADNSGHTDVSIERLLQQFVANGSRQLFDGTFVYFFEDKVQTIKVHREKNENGQVVEQFIPMDSKQQKSSRVLTNNFCSLDNNWPYQFQAMSSSFPFRINNYYQQLQQYYHFSLSDMETVAGIPAIGLFIESKDPYRYGYQLWFEPQTATLLKYKLMDQKFKAIEQYLFTDISIENQPEAENDLMPISQSSSCQHQFQGLAQAFQEYFIAHKIPMGYEPVSFRKGSIDDSERQAYQFQLSDGLSTVSVFIEDSQQPGKTINGVLKLGPVNVAGQTIEPYQVTVIGAIPVASALMFLNAIK